MNMKLIEEAEYVKDHPQRFLPPRPNRDQVLVIEAHTWRGRGQLVAKFVKCAVSVLVRGSASLLIKKHDKQC